MKYKFSLFLVFATMVMVQNIFAFEVTTRHEVRVKRGEDCSKFYTYGSYEVYSNGESSPPTGDIKGSAQFCTYSYSAQSDVVIPADTAFEVIGYESNNETHISCESNFLNGAPSRGGRSGSSNLSSSPLEIGTITLKAGDTKIFLKLYLTPVCSLTSMSYLFNDSDEYFMEILFRGLFDELGVFLEIR
jgi:hypothetical protein